MKRFILSSVIALGAFFASEASTLTYGICGDEISGQGSGLTGTYYSAAIEVPEAVAKQLAGSKVTNVSVGFGSGLTKIINVYLTYDLEGEPFYTQEGRVKANQFNDQELTTPYVIEGKKFYIGYTYRQASESGKPIGFDGANLGGMGAFSHFAAWLNGQEPEWRNASEYGALSLRATIDGDKQLTDCLVPVGLKLPLSLGFNKPFSYSLDVYNISSTPASSLEVYSKFGDETPIIYGENLAAPIEPGKRATIALNGICSTEDTDLPVAVSVSKVNGKENAWALNPANATIICSDYVSPRMIVIEEATGTQCGYCPAGYVALEMMREKYPDSFIGIAVHNYTGDPMDCASYEPWVLRYISGYPNATVNRSTKAGTFSPQPTTCEMWYNALSGVQNLKFSMEAEYVDDTKKDAVRVRTYLTMGMAQDDLDYGIALVETEDNVGPYTQSNNYAGGGRGSMYGWEDKSSYVSCIYNDVARGIHNWTGKEGSVPSSIGYREQVEYNDEIPLKSKVEKHGDVHIIALLIDRKTNEIVTAARTRIDKITGLGNNSSVSDVKSEVRVYGLGSSIFVEGDFLSADIFTLDGRRAASLAEAGSVSLPAGIYAVSVKTEGETKTSKIAIK